MFWTWWVLSKPGLTQSYYISGAGGNYTGYVLLDTLVLCYFRIDAPDVKLHHIEIYYINLYLVVHVDIIGSRRVSLVSYFRTSLVFLVDLKWVC